MYTIKKMINPDKFCSKYFKYRDFFECSDTYKKNQYINNLPLQKKTYDFIEKIYVLYS